MVYKGVSCMSNMRIMRLLSSCTGGLGFSPHDIGTVLGIAGLLLVPVSMIVFIPVSEHVITKNISPRAVP